MSTSKKKMQRNQIKIKNVQILEICNLRFISETVKERRNPPTSPRHKSFNNKNTSKLDEK